MFQRRKTPRLVGQGACLLEGPSAGSRLAALIITQIFFHFNPATYPLNKSQYPQGGLRMVGLNRFAVQGKEFIRFPQIIQGNNKGNT